MPSPEGTTGKKLKKNMTPSERAAEHLEQRKKLEEKKKERSMPGPGAYEPGAFKAKTTSMQSSSAFRSTTDRSKKIHSTTQSAMLGDPGMYDPLEALSLASKASTFKSASSKRGSNSFGNTTKRELNMNPNETGSVIVVSSTGVPDPTPGPTAYEPLQTGTGKEHNMQTRQGAETMQSAAFVSETARFPDSKEAKHMPGPGAFSPERAVEMAFPRVTGDVPKTGRDAAVVGGNSSKSGSPEIVGPGSYDVGVSGSISKRNEIASIYGSASMMSDFQRATDNLW